MEVRHLPLVQHLPHAPKYVSTGSWRAARDELKFSRCFERVLELRQAANWSLAISMGNGGLTCPPPPPPSIWDDLLEEAWFMARDLAQEARWKRMIARTLVHEAATVMTARQRRKTPTGTRRFFYQPTRQTIIDIGGVDGVGVYGPGSGLVRTATTIVTEKAGGSGPTRSPIESQDSPSKRTERPASPASTTRLQIPWTSVEDLLLLRLRKQLSSPTRGVSLICQILNETFHQGRTVRLPSDIGSRLSEVSALTGTNFNNGRRHVEHIQLMRGINSKLISPKAPSALGTANAAKKLSMSAHPSHEAAARKANQNISKLFTPQELAMRRLQRTRLVAEHHPSMGNLTGITDHGTGIPRHLPGAPPRPPGSPSLRPPATTAAANYQAAVAAVVSSQQQQQQQIPPPTGGSSQVNTGGARPPSGMVLPSAAIAQQQRQALLNRSHQIGTYISTMQASASAAAKVSPGSPLLRPPPVGSVATSPVKVTTLSSIKTDPGTVSGIIAPPVTPSAPTPAVNTSPQTRRRSATPLQQQQQQHHQNQQK